MSDSSLRTPLRINAISSTPISSKRAITNIQSYLESSQARSGGDSAIRTRLDKLSSALKAEKHTSKQVCAHWRGQTHASSSYAYVVELRSGRTIRQEGGSLQFEKAIHPFHARMPELFELCVSKACTADGHSMSSGCVASSDCV